MVSQGQESIMVVEKLSAHIVKEAQEAQSDWGWLGEA